ncbi:MAG: ROK family glucokinase [Lachnospiraceae bacterium]|nr:ROK family glucokinase [Lachnospiraceae bacterium]
MKYAVGVDLGGTTTKMGIFTEEGKVITKWEIKTRKNDGGIYILPDIAASVNKALEKQKIDKAQVTGIGMGVPGAIKPDGSVHSCVNLGWGKVMVKEEMEKLTSLIVHPANDANIAALGEMWQGGGKGCENAVMVTLGTGVGGGIIVDGKIVSGTYGFGGEIGHMKMNFEEKEVCGCGKTGCLEQYASATGVARMAKRMLHTYEKPTVLRNTDRVTAKDVFDAAKAGDELGLKVVEDVCRILALSLSYVGCVCDPEAFIIGGGVSKAGSILTDTVGRYYKDFVFGDLKKARFVLATLGNDAGIYGGARLALSV